MGRCAVYTWSSFRLGGFYRAPLGGFPVALDHVDGGTDFLLRPRPIPIEIPVPGHADQPRIRGGIEAKAGDRALEADLVAVEQLDRDQLTRVDRLCGRGAQRVLGVAQRSLPHADVAGRNVEIPCLEAKLLERGGSRHVSRCALTGPDGPALADPDSATDVSQADRQIHAAIDVLGCSATTGGADPMLVDEHEFLKRILQARLSEQRPTLLLKRRLGDARRAVCRADCSERGDGKDERASTCDQR